MTDYASDALSIVDSEMPNPLSDDLLRLYTLLALVKGVNADLEDVHDAWAIWRQTTNASHRSLVPFDQLTQEVQELDRPYVEAIRRAAARIYHPALAAPKTPGDAMHGALSPAEPVPPAPADTEVPGGATEPETSGE